MMNEPTLSKTWTRPEVQVVFARTSPDSPDPIVSVVADESEVALIERYFTLKHPNVEISWHGYKISGSEESGEVVHLVTEFTLQNPVVLAVFASIQDASARVDEEIREGRPTTFVRVQTFRLGTLVAGAPWEVDIEYRFGPEPLASLQGPST